MFSMRLRPAQLPCLLLVCTLTAVLPAALAGTQSLLRLELHTATDGPDLTGTRQRLAEHHLPVVEDYGSFVLVADTPEARRLLDEDQSSFEAIDYTLALPYLPAADPLQVELPGTRAAAGHDALAVLQFHGPMRSEWLSALDAAGVEVLLYIHPYTYLVAIPDDGLPTTAASLPALRWHGAWPLQARMPARATTAAAGRDWQVVHRPGAISAQRGPTKLEWREGPVPYADGLQLSRVALDVDTLTELARWSGVVSVQPVGKGQLRGEVSNQQMANQLAANQLPLLDYGAWLRSRGVRGSGVRIASVDNGLDQNHADLATRVQSCTGSTCGGFAAAAHGTHTAGILAADGSSQSGVNVPGAGLFLRGLGVAPGAQLIEQVYDPHFQAAGGMLTLMQQSVRNGAVISNNSWGAADTPMGYDAYTRLVDIGVRDADADTAGDQPLIYVLAIENGNGGTSTQGSPDEAKNALTVGATRAQTSAAGVDTAGWQHLSQTSAHGPALDGRRIPHLVAAGCSVDSTILAGTHGMLCGTSQAAPHVAGAAALFVEAHRKRWGTTPSPAMTKAAMLLATRDLFARQDANQQTLGHRPDAKQGWGQLRMDLLLDAFASASFIEQGPVLTASGQQHTHLFEAVRADQPVHLMLVWTDAPGHGLCGGPNCTTPAWNNDLNLRVVHNANTYLGNVFDAQGRAATGGSADGRNNAEGVLFEAGRIAAGGSFTATVEAANIAADALPNLPGSLQQDYALLCINCREPSLFADGME